MLTTLTHTQRRFGTTLAAASWWPTSSNFIQAGCFLVCTAEPGRGGGGTFLGSTKLAAAHQALGCMAGVPRPLDSARWESVLQAYLQLRQLCAPPEGSYANAEPGHCPLHLRCQTTQVPCFHVKPSCRCLPDSFPQDNRSEWLPVAWMSLYFII